MEEIALQNSLRLHGPEDATTTLTNGIITGWPAEEHFHHFSHPRTAEDLALIKKYYEMKLCLSTLLMGDDYFDGAVALAKSLKIAAIRDNQPLPFLVCLSTGPKPPEFDAVFIVPEIIYDTDMTGVGSKKAQEYYGSWIHKSYTKMHFLGLLKYFERVALLDADLLFISWPTFTEIGTPAGWFNHTRSEQHGEHRAPIKDYYPRRENGTRIPWEALYKTDHSAVPTYWPSAVIYMVDRRDGLTLDGFFEFMKTQKMPFGSETAKSGNDEIAFSRYVISRKLDMYHVGNENCVMMWHNFTGPKVVGIHFFGPHKPWRQFPPDIQRKVDSYKETAVWKKIFNMPI